MRPETSEKILTWLLRVNGFLACLAIIAVVMPTSWMDAGSRAVGLGPFPDTALTQYMVRSLSAIYALLGALVLYIAADVRKNRDLIIAVGCLTIVLGAALTAIDFLVGMPTRWTLGEGPPTVLVGAAFIYLARRMRR